MSNMTGKFDRQARGGAEVLVGSTAASQPFWGTFLVNCGIPGSGRRVATSIVGSDSCVWVTGRPLAATSAALAPDFVATSLVAGVGFFLDVVASVALTTSWHVCFEVKNPIPTSY